MKHIAAPLEINFGAPIEFRLVGMPGEDPDRLAAEAKAREELVSAAARAAELFGADELEAFAANHKCRHHENHRRDQDRRGWHANDG